MTCSKQENKERRTAQDLPPGLRQQDAAGAAQVGFNRRQPIAFDCPASMR